MKSLKTKILIEMAIISLLVLLGIGFLLGKLFLSYHHNSVFNSLKNDADMLGLYVDEVGDLEELSTKKLDALHEKLDFSLIIIDQQGKVIYKTKQPNNWNEEDRRNLVQNLIPHYKSEQLSVSKGFVHEKEIQYYFKPMLLDDGNKVFILYSVNSENLLYTPLWTLLIVCLGLAYLMILIFSYQIISRQTLPIESAARAMKELKDGNYRARSYVKGNDETSDLNQSINAVARTLQEIQIAFEVEKDRLYTLIENMGSALLLIDDKGYVSLINHAFEDLFKVEQEGFTANLYYKVIKSEEINSLIEEIFMMELNIRRQIILTIGIDRKNFEVYGAPIMGLKGEWKGILLVFHDITELKKLESIRKQFVANVSHELNTPVTSIKGFTETLLDGAMEDKEALNHFLQIISKESDRLQTLIKDLLELSQVEQAGFKLNLQDIDLVPLLDDTYAILEKKAGKKGIGMEIEKFSEPIYVKADPYRLKQVFINLVNNAISYTQPDGKVFISATEREGDVRISIRDTGIGIDKKEIPRIFERFYRVDKDRSRESGGTGLGLAIGKHIIEAHNGEIKVESEIKKGSTFTVILPKT